MNDFIEKLAFKYRDNALAKIFVRPLFRIRKKKEENQRRKIYLKNAPKLLFQLKKSLDENNIQFWLDFGTLLGAFREHDFIKHDLDLDIGTFYENHKSVREALTKNGFQVLRDFTVKKNDYEGIEETYIYLGVTIDVFYYHKRGDMMYCNTFSMIENEYNDMTRFNVKEITVPCNGLKCMNFKGLEFMVPKDTEMHLQYHYGKNFMIPNAKFDYKKEATNVCWLPNDKYVGIIKKY